MYQFYDKIIENALLNNKADMKEEYSDMNDFMNKTDIIPASELNIIEEYKRSQDIKYVAKVYDISIGEVRKILKQAGVLVRKAINNNYYSSELHDVGMRERDFYVERD